MAASADLPFPPMANWPWKDPPFFAKRRTGSRTVYTLNMEKLPANRCHMFFSPQQEEEFCIVQVLEHVTFNPRHKASNNRFAMIPVTCGGVFMLWCSFPKEFKDVCERAAQLFEVQMKIIPRVAIMSGDEGPAIEFPRHESLLFFQGERDPRLAARRSEDRERMVKLGHDLEKLGLD